MWIVAVELAILFLGSTLPTPLYRPYRQAFGFSELTLTLIYGVYVLGNLAALLVFGRLSDQIGRRRTSLPALFTAVLSTVAFLFARSTAWLFGARLISGLATGLGAGAATAWIAELHPQGDKRAAAVVAAAANLAGLGLGPLMAGLLARSAPWPLRLSYVCYLVMLFSIGIAISFARDTVEKPISDLAELFVRPRLGLPRDIRSKFISPAVTAFGIFSLIGFYAALIPGLLADSLHQTSPALTGIVVFALFTIGAFTVILTRNLRSQTAMLTGLFLLLPSLARLTLAQARRSMLLLNVAVLFGGVSAALGYCGSLEVVNEISPENKRSEIISSYLVACYAGNSVRVCDTEVAEIPISA